jgi:molybdopterin molybdotransferase
VKVRSDPPISIDEALRILLAAVEPIDTERIDLAGAAGRVLAEDVRADRDFPPADLSAMDGYAVRSADASRPGAVLRVLGEARAGGAPGIVVAPGTASRIMTGAVLPAGADAVVMVERTTERGDSVELHDVAAPGQNVRARGVEAVRGSVAVRGGARIRAAEIAALAAVGSARPLVYRRPAVSVVATGDEIVPAATAHLADHQIRNSNAPAVCALLGAMGAQVSDLGTVADDRAALDERLAAGLEGELLLVTGGVSVGTHDLVADGLTRAGAERLFHGVSMKPGKPVLAVRRGRCLAVGLPGNPVSACTVFAVLVAPALRRLMGLSRWDNVYLRATLDEPLAARSGRATYHLARLEAADGVLHARPIDSRGSGDVLSLVRADGWLVTPAAGGDFAAGTELPALPWRLGFEGP